MFIGVLHDIKKSKTSLQPIFEAFTNALEAIKLKTNLISGFQGEIEIVIRANSNLTGNPEFNSLSISDNGVGFDTAEFKRFNTFKDFTKGFKNLGSGRIQFAHYFDSTEIQSLFEQEGKFFERNFIVSKNESFLKHNAIVLLKHLKETEKKHTNTRVTFSGLLDKSNIYNALDEQSLKNSIIERYVHYFCHNISNLPKIKITYYLQGEFQGETTISKQDVPKIDKTEVVKLEYTRLADNGNYLEKTSAQEDFIIDAFKIDKNILKSNDLKLVSKGEIIEESGIELQSLAENDNVKGFKYLFLVSSNYIDARDTNLRGILNIPTLDSFSKNADIFTPEEIILEDIQNGVNVKIRSMYPEIEKVQEEHDFQLNKLKEMFLLDDATAKDLNISINDSETKILEKFYEAEAKKSAVIDASIKESIETLDHLDTTSDDYAEKLESEIEKLVRVIPLQNKTSLTHYVARRKLVLDLFQKILNKKLTIQSSNKGGKFSESLIHNLLFQQQSENPNSSDLWIINEDFIYFKGSSEKQLSKVEINGEKIFKKEFHVNS